MDRSISSGVLSVAGVKVLTLAIGILTTPILYRLLGVEKIGTYYGLLAPFSLLMIFVSSGVGDGVRKYIAENRAIPDWQSHVVGFYFRLAIGLALIGATLVLLTVWSGISGLVFNHTVELYIYLLAILVITSQFREYTRRTLMGLGLERYSEPLLVLQKVMFIGVALPLVYFGFGIAGALAGKIAASGVVAIVGLFLVNRQISLRSVFTSAPNRFPSYQMLTFNSRSIVLILFLTSLYKIDVLMLTLWTTETQVGYYQGALELAEFLWFVPLAFQTVFVHSTSELWSEGRTEKISQLTARTTRYTFLLSGVMAIGIAALAQTVVPLYFGQDFLPAVTPLLLLLPGAVGFAVARPILAISQGKGDLMYPIIATGTAAGINFGLNTLLIPRYGMHGAAIATSIGYGSMFLFHVWSAWEVGFNPLSDARLGRITVTTASAAVPIFALSQLINSQINISVPWIKLLTLQINTITVGVPLSLVVIPPLGFSIYLVIAFVTRALGICEFLRILSSFPTPIGSFASWIRCHTPLITSKCR